MKKKITVYKNYFFYETKISKLLHFFFTNNKNNFKSKTYKLFSAKKKTILELQSYFLKEVKSAIKIYLSHKLMKTLSFYPSYDFSSHDLNLSLVENSNILYSYEESKLSKTLYIERLNFFQIEQS